MSIIVERKRRAEQARNFPHNTCPASRHVHLIADALFEGRLYPMMEEEPEHCASSMYAVLAELWETRTELSRLKSG